MRKEMTFTDLLVLLLKKFNAILIVAIVAGIVLGGSGIALLVAHYSNAETKAELQEKFKDEQERYWNQLEIERQKLQVIENRKALLDDYAENSIFYSLNSTAVDQYEIVFSVNALNEPDGSSLNAGTQFFYFYPAATNQLVAVYMTSLRRDQVYDEFRKVLGKDLKSEYIDELISVDTVSAPNVLCARVKAGDSATAQALAEALVKSLNQIATDACGAHEFNILSSQALTVSDNTIRDKQNGVLSEQTTLLDQIKSENEVIKNLEKNTPEPEVLSISKLARRLILWGGLGGVLGAGATILIVILAYLFSNRVGSPEDITRRYNLEILGIMPETNPKKYLFGKLIESLEDRAKPASSRKDGIRLAAEGIKLFLSGEKDKPAILLTGSVGADELTSLGADLGDCLPAAAVQTGSDCVVNADTLEKLQSSDFVVLAEKLGTSKLSDIDRQVLKIEKVDRKIIGIILL
ncbi:hypothetical protein [Anaerotruncus colihominis]|uniref:Capsular polysaccharide biosynthesis protein n=1 Tax=Anaerotruncus colihominis TaxID=169435 RepID=A0A174L3N3_9FIRM|nr:hypothetical protein [Anaerotruncus colihominis]MBS4987345.1 hypothetical protein [Anaerotruncus colihominis]MCQ4731963.1 hypothetical protein [Anaerotruncus colihominis]CUP18852.1 Capsular polysaccharide biosynthesis protein [Anaerotruncus colihominis]